MNQKTKKLYELLLKIPKGKVTSYKILAEKLKTNPRAIGRMLNANKEPHFYPCYKVVHHNGELGGYEPGIERKIQLLKRDGIHISNNRIPDIEKRLFKF